LPELPDIEAYLAALRPRLINQPIQRLRILGPSILRTFDPPIESAEGCVVGELSRLGKRIVMHLGGPGDLALIIHLMIAGRFQWKDKGSKPPGKITSAIFEFPTGVLFLTEAGTKKRAQLHLVSGREALATHDPGGLDIYSCSQSDFAAALRRENHTIKRTLTDPRILSGIGNAYSDEILHAAKLSPIKMTTRLTDDEIARLLAAARERLSHWTGVLTTQFLRKFPGPGEVTAFRPDFAVHGKYGQPCPVCGSPVQRIVYAENETNYCATCQTGGKLLADRSMSRLLKDDWPRTLEELEESSGATPPDEQ
jgi:formamidopyrimidine-DNA glycosylase